VFRPNHADYAYVQKYGRRDPRGGGRFVGARDCQCALPPRDREEISAREVGLQIRGYRAQIGPLVLEMKDWSAVEQNPFFCGDPRGSPNSKPI